MILFSILAWLRPRRELNGSVRSFQEAILALRARVKPHDGRQTANVISWRSSLWILLSNHRSGESNVVRPGCAVVARPTQSQSRLIRRPSSVASTQTRLAQRGCPRLRHERHV